MVSILGKLYPKILPQGAQITQFLFLTNFFICFKKEVIHSEALRWDLAFQL